MKGGRKASCFPGVCVWDVPVGLGAQSLRSRSCRPGVLRAGAEETALQAV